MFSQILVAVDFSAPSEAALVQGRALAHALQARLHLLHVLPSVFFRAVVSDPRHVESAVAHRWLERAHELGQPLRAAAAVERSDDPAEAIVRYAGTNGIDLIVIGTHGRRGLAHALTRSVAEQVVRRAPCPVLAVRRKPPAQRETRGIFLDARNNFAERSRLLRRMLVRARFNRPAAGVN